MFDLDFKSGDNCTYNYFLPENKDYFTGTVTKLTYLRN